MSINRRQEPANPLDQRRFIGLGRAAERFIIADRDNRVAQKECRRLKALARDDHDGKTPRFEVSFPGDPDEEAPLDEQFVALPIEEWCSSCRLD